MTTEPIATPTAPAVFESSPSVGKVFAALAKAQAQITTAPKDRENPHFRSAYATLDSVWETARGHLSNEGISVLQFASTSAQPKAVTVRTVLGHASGEWVGCALTVETPDLKPQTVGSAISYARRYGFSALVMVTTGEDDDGEAASSRGPAPQQQPQRAPQQAQGARGPAGHGKAGPAKAEPRGEAPAQAGEDAQAIEAWTKKLEACTDAEALVGTAKEMAKSHKKGSPVYEAVAARFKQLQAQLDAKHAAGAQGAQ